MGLYEWIIWDYNGLYGGRCFDKVEQPHRDVTGISVRDSFPLTELFSLGNYWWFLLVVPVNTTESMVVSQSQPCPMKGFFSIGKRPLPFLVWFGLPGAYQSYQWSLVFSL